jgi:hypothetical protein
LLNNQNKKVDNSKPCCCEGTVTSLFIIQAALIAVTRKKDEPKA